MMEGGVRVLIYAGDVDFICNWMGNKAWTKELSWTGHDDFNAAKDLDFVYGSDSVGGLVRTAQAKKGSGSLSFLQVYGGGHMVPMDQPEASLEMLNDFIFDRSFTDKDGKVAHK